MERLKNPFASSEPEGSQTNENVKNSNDDFIAFSDTSTPAKSNNDNFRPKRGKSNRMGNWQRFAAFNQEHQSPIPSPQRRTWNHDNLSKQNYHQRGSPNNYRGNQNYHNLSASGSTPNYEFAQQHSHRGTPRSDPGMSRGGPYRGAPGFFGTPQQSSSKPFNRGGHFSNPNYPQRGSFRGNRSRGRSNNRYPFSSFSKDRGDAGNGYFHPEMLEDPWKDLIAKSDSNLSNATSSVDDVNSAKMSDSMIPQLDDTVLQRHQDMHENVDLEKTLSDSKCSPNTSDYGESSEEDNVVITIGESSNKSSSKINIPQDEDSQENSTKSNDTIHRNDISRSDSMIPLIGDSILVQDVTIDN